MTKQTRHHEWLSLIDVSGPFLAAPVLEKVFPQGLESVDPLKRRHLRQAYDEWREALDLEDPRLVDIHQAWGELVLTEGLDLNDEEGDTLRSGDRLPDGLSYRHPESSVTLNPAYVVVDDQHEDKPLMLVAVHGPEVDLDSTIEGDGWATSPAERMVQLCRATETRLGLVTNGERWMLVDAPVGAVTTFASWYARLWSQEPMTLQAFVTLLGINRFFDAKDRRLSALLDDSLQHQDEVTDALGKQVQRAVDVLIQSLNRANHDRNQELLKGIPPGELYEAALTVMMRLVFLLNAEERELMDVVKDERFQTYYAVSSLRIQLREQAGLHSEELLSHRRDAWSRLLAIFRAIYGGIEHEALRMPALGGSLFDPDRFPFLEGRIKGTSWRTDEARPLPIDNRTALLLLDAIQMFQGRTLSYRALDVENIGYVYEGLLEHTVERAKEVILDLDATKSAKKPWVGLEELESAEEEGGKAVERLLKERTGSAISRVRNDLKKSVDPEDNARLLAACHNDQSLCNRIAPYFHLLRIDSWGYPLAYPQGSYMVTTGTDRRETGTHYTPKSLTEAIVTETLEPVAYVGPAEGEARENWRLKSSEELLDLKVCDPAMGSGAFLVQACRWLSERLLEAWQDEERAGKCIRIDGKSLDSLEGGEPLPRDVEERLLVARRLIAKRCLYGVDINPMAVELAKLSIWLVTLAKGRPFGFLDHNLRSGDSLLGIHDLDQLRCLDMEPNRAGSGRKLFAQAIDQAVDEAVELCKRLRQRLILDIHDVEAMAELDKEARRKLELPELIADALVGEVLAAGGKEVDTAALSIKVGQAIEGNAEAIDALRRKTREVLSTDLPNGKPPRHPLHWPLEFPEVFERENGGFDAIIGNPPFLGGKKITNFLGVSYRAMLVQHVANGRRGNADLSAYFCLIFSRLLRERRLIGMLASNTLPQGETRRVCLNQILENGYTISRAVKSLHWPGRANLEVSIVWIFHGAWKGKVILDGKSTDCITSALEPAGDITGEPFRLRSNVGNAFQGSNIRGIGFTLEKKVAIEFVKTNQRNRDVLFPFLGGKDLLSSADHQPSRWVINFFDWKEEKSASYPELFQIVKERVLPERKKIKDKTKQRLLSRLYWQYDSQAKTMYKKIVTTHP